MQKIIIPLEICGLFYFISTSGQPGWMQFIIYALIIMLINSAREEGREHERKNNKV